VRNVDCEWIVDGTQTCSHEKLGSMFGRLFGYPKCLEYRYEHIDCHYRQSLWDMLKKENKSGSYSGKVNRPNVPPPRMPPIRKMNF